MYDHPGPIKALSEGTQDRALIQGLQVAPAVDLIEGPPDSIAPAVVGAGGEAEHWLCHS